MRKLTRRSSQAHRLEHHVGDILAMLKEIHAWFLVNLQNSKLSAGVLPSRTSQQGPLFSGLTFELYVQSTQGLDLVCSRASLHPKWSDKQNETTPSYTNELGPQLFSCQCEGQPLHAKIADFGRKFQFLCGISTNSLVFPTLHQRS
jgi:hypothetical protein